MTEENKQTVIKCGIKTTNNKKHVNNSSNIIFIKTMIRMTYY